MNQIAETPFELPFPEAGFAALVGSPKEVENFRAYLLHGVSVEIAKQLDSLERRLSEKYGELPIMATSKAWAAMKLKGSGKPYGARSFENFAKAAGLEHLKTESGFWPKEVGIKWLEA